MKRLLTAVVIFSLILLGFSSVSMAYSILFPYINSNPTNVSTVVNVINTANNLVVCPGGFLDSLDIHYRYFTKPSSGAGSLAIDLCNETSIIRPTTYADIVTFDLAGNSDGGNAMFGDITPYGGTFDLPHQGVSAAVRGFVLVTHHCESVIPGGTADYPLYPGDLDGEAMLIDIVNGAAWGYRAVISDPGAIGLGPYAFSPNLGAGATPAIGMTTDLLPEDVPGSDAIAFVSPPFVAVNNYSQGQPIALYPPDEATTRFFVTPLFIDSAAVAAGQQNDMHLSGALVQKRTQFRLLDHNGDVGVDDRDENAINGGGPVHVRCVAGIGLDQLIGSIFTSPWAATGGWAFTSLVNPTVIDPAEVAMVAGDYNAIVFKLEFSTLFPFAAGDALNQGDLIRDGRIW